MRLVRLMRRLPKRNLAMWTYNPKRTFRGIHEHDDPTTTTKALKCGTSCCVAGWAAIQNYETWPKGLFGQLSVYAGNFQEFYGFSARETNRICLGVDEESPARKADQIERILNTKRYARAREGALG
jgi:hypothetical protein